MARNYIPTSPEHEFNARKQSKFLRLLLENGGFVQAAIRECHTSRRWLNDQLDNDEGFAELFAAIKDQNNERLEQEIYRRGFQGVDKPLSFRGELTGASIKEYSDNLAMFYAKANMPEKYRDLPQKGKDISDADLDARISAYIKKQRAEETPLTTQAVN